MDTTKTAKSAAKFALDPFEALGSQAAPIAKSFLDEAGEQAFGFFKGARFSPKPKEIAGEELKRARNEKRIEEMQAADKQDSEDHRKKIRDIYIQARQEVKMNQADLKQDLQDLTQEVVSLANTVGQETKIHLQNTPKVGKLDITFVSFVVRLLRVKAEESKSAKSLVNERRSAKTGGMLAWVTGKQMQIHEQGTLQLQG
jgi:hypothetical protein